MIEPRRLSKTQSTYSRKPVRRLSSAPLAISKLFAGTTKERSGGESSKSATSYSGGPNRQRKTQTLSAMGRTLYGDRSDPTGCLPTEGRQRQCSHQHLEHRTVMSFLPLKFSLYHFSSFNVRSCKAPWPENFWPGSLGGSTRV